MSKIPQKDQPGGEKNKTKDPLDNPPRYGFAFL